MPYIDADAGLCPRLDLLLCRRDGLIGMRLLW